MPSTCSKGTVAEGTDFLLEKSNVPLNEATMLRCCHPVYFGRSREVHNQVTDQVELLIPCNHNDLEATYEVHLVRHVKGFPYKCFCSKTKVCHRGEAYLCAVGGEIYVLVDKEVIDCQLNILLELDELLRNLDDALRHVLVISSHRVLFSTDQPQIISAALTLLGVTLHPEIPPALTITLKSAVEG